MNKIDNLLNRVVEVKMLRHQELVDRLNDRHKEDLPPLFWVIVSCIVVLVMSNWLS